MAWLFFRVPARRFVALGICWREGAAGATPNGGVHTAAVPEPPLPHARQSVATLLHPPRQLPGQLPARAGAAFPVPQLQALLLAADLPPRLPRPPAGVQRAVVPAADQRQRPAAVRQAHATERTRRAVQVPQSRARE